MRIDFDSKNYIDFSFNNAKVIISIGASDPKNSLNLIVNSCEITLNELSQLINDLKVPLPPIK